MPWSVAAAVAGSVVSSAMSSGSSSGSSGGGSAAGGAAQAVGGYLAAQDAQKFGNEVVQTADPFQQYRSGFAGQLNAAANAAGNPNTTYQQANQQLSGLLNDPSSVYKNPLYQAQYDQGLQAVQRTSAAQGQSVSGNEMTALQQFGTTNAANFYNQQVNSLSGLSNQSFAQAGQLSGLSQANLGAAAQAQSNIYGNVNSSYNAMGQGLGQLAGAAGNGIGNAVSGAINNLGNSTSNTAYGTNDGNAPASGFTGGLMGGSPSTNTGGGSYYGGDYSGGWY